MRSFSDLSHRGGEKNRQFPGGRAPGSSPSQRKLPVPSDLVTRCRPAISEAKKEVDMRKAIAVFCSGVPYLMMSIAISVLCLGGCVSLDSTAIATFKEGLARISHAPTMKKPFAPV